MRSAAIQALTLGTGAVLLALLATSCLSPAVLMMAKAESDFLGTYRPTRGQRWMEALDPYGIRGGKLLAGARSPSERDPKYFSQDCVLGLAISGGGSISAAYAYGVVAELAKPEYMPDASGTLIRSAVAQVDYISTASGGGLMGLMLSRLMLKEGLAAEAGMAEKVQALLSTGRYQMLLSEKYLTRKQLLTSALSTTQGQRRLARTRQWLATTFARPDLQKAPRCSAHVRFDDVFLPPVTGAPNVAPVWIANATSYADGRRIPLTPAVLKALGVQFPKEPLGFTEGCEGLPASDALAASAAFPGIGPFRLEAKNGAFLDLVDGGMSDNLGLRTGIEIVRHGMEGNRRGLLLVLDSSLDAHRGTFGQGPLPSGDDYALHSAGLGLASQYPEANELASEASVLSQGKLEVIFLRASDIDSKQGSIYSCAGLQPGNKKPNTSCPNGSPQTPSDPVNIRNEFLTSMAIAYQDADVLATIGAQVTQKAQVALRKGLQRCMNRPPSSAVFAPAKSD